MKKFLLAVLFFTVHVHAAQQELPTKVLALSDGSSVTVPGAFVARSKVLTNLLEDLDVSDDVVLPIPFSYATGQAIDIITTLLGADHENIKTFFAANTLDTITPVLATAHFLDIDLFRADEHLKHEILSLVFNKFNNDKKAIEVINAAGLSDVFREFLMREVTLSADGEITAAEFALKRPAFYLQERIEFIDQDGQVVEARDGEDQEQDLLIFQQRVVVDFYEQNVTGNNSPDYLAVSLVLDNPDFGRLQAQDVRIIKHHNNYFCIAIYDFMDGIRPIRRTIRVIDLARQEDVHVGRLHLRGNFFTNESHQKIYLQYFSDAKNLVTLNLELPRHLTISVPDLRMLEDGLYIETIQRIHYGNEEAILLVQENPRTMADGTNKHYTVSLYNFDGSLIYRDQLEPSWLYYGYMAIGRYYVSDENILYYICYNQNNWSLARYDLIAHKRLKEVDQINYIRPDYFASDYNLELWYDKENKRFIVIDYDVDKYFVFKYQKSKLGGSQFKPLSELHDTFDQINRSEQERVEFQQRESLLGLMMEQGVKDIEHEKHISDVIQRHFLKNGHIPPFTQSLAPTEKIFYLRFYKELQEIKDEIETTLYKKLEREIITKLNDLGVYDFGRIDTAGPLRKFVRNFGDYLPKFR